MGWEPWRARWVVRVVRVVRVRVRVSLRGRKILLLFLLLLTLVLGGLAIGAHHHAGGKGEISVPVGKMGEAMERAYDRERHRKREGVNRQVLVVEVSLCFLAMIACL